MTAHPKLDWFNGLPLETAKAELARCCNAERWARQVAERRPFETPEALIEAANAVWHSVGLREWRSAVDHHPRIGARGSEERFESTRRWSAEEQAAARAADQRTRRRLEEGQLRYEEKFGHIFLVCATGKSASELVDTLEARLANDRETEITVAAEELRRIMNLRLEKLLDGEPDHDSRS